jgi:threonine-phosphate decarboxylase
VERPRLAAGLKLLGFDVLPGAANYLCFRVPGGTAELVAALRARGILIRSCADYVGLGSSYYRIAVRTTADNDRLLEALAEVTRR